jgi:hypothetical protein
MCLLLTFYKLTLYISCDVAWEVWVIVKLNGLGEISRSHCGEDADDL